MKLQEYNARDLWFWPEEDIWNLPNGPIRLNFDDGPLDTFTRETIFSYYLGVFHREFPDLPLLKRHHIGNETFTNGTHTRVLGHAMWDCIDHYGDGVDEEYLSYLVCEANNHIYNVFTVKLRPHVSTISITDFIDCLDEENIKEANENVKPSQDSISRTYQTIENSLMYSPELKGNAVAEMCRSSLVSMGQTLQCLGPRGYLTDANSYIFPNPVLTGYARGVHKLLDSMMESRSATKAAIFTKDPVAASEHFNREMQLACTTVVRLHKGDCGAREYIPFKVRSTDLKNIAGKFYLDENGVEQEIRHDSHGIKGKLIQMRSPLTCIHPDEYGVCSRCFGKLSHAVPRDTNLGHVSTTLLCEIISQNVLSTKHLDGSSKVDPFDVLTDYDKNFIVAKDDSVLKLSDKIKGAKVEMVLMADQASGITDIDYVDINKLDPAQITELTEVTLNVHHSNGTREDPTLPVSMGSRRSYLSMEALEYIKKKGWRLSDLGNYVIDLSDFDWQQPLFRLPLKHTDMVQYMKGVRTFIMTSQKSKNPKARETLRDFPSVHQALLGFYNLISSKLSVNIAHLEIILLTTMVRDAEAGDCRIPRPATSGTIGSYNDNMSMRSLAPPLAYQGQVKILTSRKSFIYRNRPDHPMDNLVCPYPEFNPRQ